MLVMDADALIKLNRAGVLVRAGGAFRCVVPAMVYEEAVTRGKARLYPDAEQIESAVSQAMTISAPSRLLDPQAGLSAGDLQVLSLARERHGAIVVSDDRRLLTSAARLGLAFTTPAQLVVALARRGELSVGEGLKAVDTLRPLVRPVVHDQAVRNLAQMKEEERS